MGREVRRLAGPAIASSLLQTMVFVVDRLMLGRHGEHALAGIQIGGALEWSVWSVFAAFEVGAIARVGRHVGGGDRPAAARATFVSTLVAFGLGAVVALATPLVLANLHLVAAGASEPVLAEARAYLGTTLRASPFVFAAMNAVACLQAGGDSRTPLALGVAVNLVHVALNRVLILGAFGVPALGSLGAGVSTAVTFALEAVLALLALGRAGQAVSLRPDVVRAGLAELGLAAEGRALAVVAVPAFVERCVYHAGFVGYVALVNRLGDAVMAANQALISIESVCFLSADGFGIAAAALVAQRGGAGDPAGARAAARVATGYAAVTLTALGGLAFVLRDVLVPAFGGGDEVVRLGVSAMPVLAFAQPFMAVAMVRAQALRGAGRTREALLVSFVGALVVRLGAAWLVTVVVPLGLAGVWLASTADWVVRTALLARVGRFGAAAPAPAEPQR